MVQMGPQELIWVRSTCGTVKGDPEQQDGQDASVPRPALGEVHGDAEYHAGSRADFERLYQEMYSRVYFFLLTVVHGEQVAEDCTQETFVKAYQAWPRWKPHAKVSTWLFTIAYHVAMSHIRKEKNKAADELDDRVSSPDAPHSQGPTPALEGVYEAIQLLPAEQAACVVLRHEYGYTSREIGSMLGIPESTVSSRLLLARNKLKKLLDAEEAE